jgi:uncharacterized membrane protein
MPRVSATIELPGRVYDAETAWYDTARWPQWVDGLARVVEVRGEWPKTGSEVIWESHPAGRGTVRERVAQYAARSGQTSDVDDDSISARQSVNFRPKDEGLEVQLTLEYAIKRRSAVSGLVDLLFIRRLMGASLGRTLSQFRAVVEAAQSS